jgi:glycosyltransferase involved in cell wall biosynthesis
MPRAALLELEAVPPLPAAVSVPVPEASAVLMSPTVVTSRARVTVDGKFFRVDGRKFHPKGVTYGPFGSGPEGDGYSTREQTLLDLDRIRELGANTLRVYHLPPRWFLDLLHEQGLKVLVDVPWNKHLCFLDSEEARQDARDRVRRAARLLRAHPAVFALSVVNEIPADIVRWSGAGAVADFLDLLVADAKAEDPELLCTFGNFPPTEFLRPRDIDFHCFNVYLHERRPFENYLARLQMLADTKPLVLGEFGIDSLREGRARQAEILGWKIEATFRGGGAGVFVYSFTDDWFKDGRSITDWEFGLTTREREPKPAFEVVQAKYRVAPYFPLPASPRVSVVVASYNGASTLKTCLQSLETLNYPDFEVVLVDDGSTDPTPEIAALFPKVRNIRHETNRGLSAARNTGIYAANGEIIAFTDSDCRADEDWLFYVVGDLLYSGFAGMGGHNFLPGDDSAVAAAVMVSPGGPAHVMLTDRVAEHIPGCNMVFHRWALVELGGFDPVYRKAGDDVDVCWRLQQRGYRIGFSPGGFVWHYRRNTVQAYLRQQSGYGDAEALLERRHPENFNRFGGSIWHGRIYSPAKIGVETSRPIIYHGLFGTGFFQSIYTSNPGLTLLVLTSLEYHFLATLPLLVLGSVVPHVGTIGVASLVLSLVMCVVAACQADLPRTRRRWWSRPLVALLFLLQPVVRGWARHQNHLRGQQTPLSARETLDSLSLEGREESLHLLRYWSEGAIDRTAFLKRVLERLDERSWQNKPDGGWSRYDVEIYGNRWARLRLVTAGEYLSNGTQVLRCRLDGSWSFLARALFSSIAGALLIVIGFLGGWWWGLLMILPPLAWRIHLAEVDLTRLIVSFLDERAKEFGLVKLPPSSTK